MLNDIARIRRFNRAVSTEIGALDTDFLGRGRPLGVARCLWTIGAVGIAITELREKLGIDSGLLSRLLRVLEAEALIVLSPDAMDARRRFATPTATGRTEICAYDRLSDDRAKALLAAQGRQAKALLDAMDLIASALNRDRIEVVLTDPESEDARFCLQCYYDLLNERFDTGFTVSKSRDPQADTMRPPKGGFWVAFSDQMPIGCVGLKGGQDYGEVKRLWVADHARGLGLARRLMQVVEDQARALGMTRLRLDTNEKLPEAIALYRATGWSEIARFNDDPYPTHFFEKML